jgi:hypothetical protein
MLASGSSARISSILVSAYPWASQLRRVRAARKAGRALKVYHSAFDELLPRHPDYRGLSMI